MRARTVGELKEALAYANDRVAREGKAMLIDVTI